MTMRQASLCSGGSQEGECNAGAEQEIKNPAHFHLSSSSSHPFVFTRESKRVSIGQPGSLGNFMFKLATLLFTEFSSFDKSCILGA